MHPSQKKKIFSPPPNPVRFIPPLSVCEPMSRVTSLLRPMVDSDRSLLATEANASLAGSNVMRDHRWYSDVVKNVRSEAVWFQVSTAVWARVRSDAFVFGRYMSSMAVFGI